MSVQGRKPTLIAAFNDPHIDQTGSTKGDFHPEFRMPRLIRFALEPRLRQFRRAQQGARLVAGFLPFVFRH